MADVQRRRRKKVAVSPKWKQFRLIMIGIFIIIFAYQGYSLYALHVEKEQLQQQLKTLQDQNKELEEERKKLEDTSYIERIARDELGLVKQGEVPYVR